MKHLPRCRRIKVISSVFYTNLISKDWQMVGAIKAKKDDDEEAGSGWVQRPDVA